MSRWGRPDPTSLLGRMVRFTVRLGQALHDAWYEPAAEALPPQPPSDHGATAAPLPGPGVVPSYLDSILEDLLREWQPMPVLVPHQRDLWFGTVGFWLARVSDEDAYQRWLLRFALVVQASNDLPLSLAVWMIHDRVVEATKGVRVCE